MSNPYDETSYNGGTMDTGAIISVLATLATAAGVVACVGLATAWNGRQRLARLEETLEALAEKMDHDAVRHAGFTRGLQSAVQTIGDKQRAKDAFISEQFERIAMKIWPALTGRLSKLEAEAATNQNFRIGAGEDIRNAVDQLKDIWNELRSHADQLGTQALNNVNVSKELSRLDMRTDAMKAETLTHVEGAKSSLRAEIDSLQSQVLGVMEVAKEAKKIVAQAGPRFEELNGDLNMAFRHIERINQDLAAQRARGAAVAEAHVPITRKSQEPLDNVREAVGNLSAA